jgi:DNA-binding response OmpR family regulator
MPDETNKSENGAAPTYRLLAIDDDPLILQAMGDYLSHFGFDFQACAYTDDGCAAYDAVFGDGNSSPDVVLADYRLPGAKNGLDLIAEIRAHFSGDIPAILFSGDVSLDSEIAGAIPQDIKLLHKPVRMQLLSEELKALLAG